MRGEHSRAGSAVRRTESVRDVLEDRGDFGFSQPRVAKPGDGFDTRGERAHEEDQLARNAVNDVAGRVRDSDSHGRLWIDGRTERPAPRTCPHTRSH